MVVSWWNLQHASAASMKGTSEAALLNNMCQNNNNSDNGGGAGSVSITVGNNTTPPHSSSAVTLSTCSGCGLPITDQFILRVSPDLEWHASCLACVECGTTLDENCTCYVREGRTYCKQDYLRLYGTRCAKCGKSFGRSDFVMRAKSKIFHVDCFRCTACAKRLVQGDEFALVRDSDLYCKSDHEVVESGGVGGATTASVKAEELAEESRLLSSADADDKEFTVNLKSEANDGRGSIEETSGARDLEPLETSDKNSSLINSGQAEPGNTSPTGSNSSTASSTNDSSGLTTSGGHSGGRSRSHHKENSHKTTRIRTVLNEKQLHTLRTCYGANPRPDALMKEQLVEMTGLSPRVIRVWFQNKRCKDKKRSILMKHIHQQQQEKGSIQGVPMVATEPVRHEPNVSMQPVEVQSYQPPAWKALSDFALQTEMDTAPYQQLVSSFETDSSPTPPPLAYLNGEEPLVGIHHIDFNPSSHHPITSSF